MSLDHEALKPCPFCGGTDLRVSTYDVQPDDYHSGYVNCDECDAQGCGALTLDGWLSSKSEAHTAAITAWNTRATPSPSTDTLERPEAIEVSVPLAFYEWLETIERDTRVHDLTPHEQSALCAALTPSPRVDEGAREEGAYDAGLKTLTYYLGSDHKFSVEYMAMGVVQDALRAYKAALATTTADPRAGENGSAQTYADFQQRRGRLPDLIEEALSIYAEFMKDDAYDAQRPLDKIADKLRSARAFYDTPASPSTADPRVGKMETDLVTRLLDLGELRNAIDRELGNARHRAAGDFKSEQHQGQRGQDWDHGFIAAWRIVEAECEKARATLSKIKGEG